LAIVVLYLSVRHAVNQTRPPVHPSPALIAVRVATDPADARVTMDGKPLSGNTAEVAAGLHHSLQVSRLGYETKELDVAPGSEWNVKLDPEPIHIRIQVSESQGKVFLDDNPIGNLVDG